MLKSFVMYEDADYAIDSIEGEFKINRLAVPYYCDLDDLNNKEVIYKNRIVLRAGTNASIKLSKGYKHDEGYSFIGISVVEEDGQWFIESVERGSDCDGVTESYFKGVSDGGSDASYNNKYFPTLSDRSLVKKIEESEYDQFAEIAGY